MTTMISEVYDALKDSTGVTDEKARKAVAQVDQRYFELKTSIEALRGEMNAGFERVEGDMKAEFARVNGNLAFDRWVLLLIVGGIVTLTIKAFF